MDKRDENNKVIRGRGDSIPPPPPPPDLAAPPPHHDIVTLWFCNIFYYVRWLRTVLY
eukprot:TRINITY_DN3189_c0_g1_i1.p1 TRINITY_DN3189_c0_g1~~TRINITY_DN3189_c0_g1_i1.p1  ORF type:complete len:57 (+),score=11.71 TRINITY_DN3189_c0_g1_i1:129-299(+)